MGLGGIGVAIPVMPTTPFILLAAVCFSAGNTRLSNWLQQSPFFGPFIENYKTKQGVRVSLKVVSIAILWTGLGISMIVIQAGWAYIVLPIVGLCVTIHLLSLKTKYDDSDA